MNSEFLTYGSIISISSVLDGDSFITSNGFVKRNVMLRNFVFIILENFSIFKGF